MSDNLKLAAIFCLLIIGCEASKTESTVPVATAKSESKEQGSNAANTDSTSRKIIEPTEKTIGGVKFEFPAGWEEKTPPNSVIIGEYHLPSSAGAGRLTLSITGGGTALNMDRWKGQFQRGPDDPEAKESQISVDGKEVTLIEIHGTFNDAFGGGGPKPNWQLLGVAIPIDSQQNYFVKLTGPRETLTEKRPEFIKFVQSARFE